MNRDIVVIGGSAGAIEALLNLLPALPADLAAAVFVVVHTAPTGPSALPYILRRSSALPVVPAEDGAAIVPGKLFVARPDHHLTLREDRMVLTRGPRENRNRPAIDPLFRSAARAYGRRVIGVLLSGALDDGVAGLALVKRGGGVALVQAPETALADSIPELALEQVKVDFSGSPSHLGEELARLVSAPLPRAGDPRSAIEPNADDPRAPDTGRPSVYSCPDCNGTLWELDDAGRLRFRCRVGHAFSSESLIDAQQEALEGALWAGVRALEESASLAERMADRTDRAGQNHSARRFFERARDLRNQADLIRAVLEQGTPSSPPLTPARVLAPEESD